jgi:hypothetical protein
MKTKFIKIDGWDDVLDACRHTVSKAPLNKMPSDKFKKDILIAEHGPIREVVVKWLWEQIPHWVGVHWVRHKWECYVATQRSDRTGIPREKLPQDEPQNFMGSANAQNTIDTWRKRLCYKASPETRELAEDFKYWLKHEMNQPEWADVLVPNCVYRCGCPETEPCGFWDNFIKSFYNADYHYQDLGKIRCRYDHYSNMFYKKMESKEND